MPSGTSSQNGLPILEIILYTRSLLLSLGFSIFMCSTPSFSPFFPRGPHKTPGYGDLSQQHRQKKHAWRHKRQAGLWAEIFGSSQNQECLEDFRAKNNAHLILFPSGWNETKKKLHLRALFICTAVLAGHVCAAGTRLYWRKESPQASSQAVFHLVCLSWKLWLFVILSGKQALPWWSCCFLHHSAITRQRSLIALLGQGHLVRERCWTTVFVQDYKNEAKTVVSVHWNSRHTFHWNGSLISFWGHVLQPEFLSAIDNFFRYVEIPDI